MGENERTETEGILKDGQISQFMGLGDHKFSNCLLHNVGEGKKVLRGNNVRWSATLWGWHVWCWLSSLSMLASASRVVHPMQRANHTGCIFLVFLLCVFSSVFSVVLPMQQGNHTGWIFLVFLYSSEDNIHFWFWGIYPAPWNVLYDGMSFVTQRWYLVWIDIGQGLCLDRNNSHRSEGGEVVSDFSLRSLSLSGTKSQSQSRNHL